MIKVTFLLLVVSVLSPVALCGHYGGGGGGNNNDGYGHDYSHNPHYQFSYGVNDHHTGDVKHHKESRNGDAVHGEYSLVEPGGHVRKVTYVADKGGFRAQVHRTPGHGGGGGGGGGGNAGGNGGGGGNNNNNNFGFGYY